MSALDKLNHKLNEICDLQDFDVKWFFKDLATGQSLNRNGDEIGPSASTRKISILIRKPNRNLKNKLKNNPNKNTTPWVLAALEE